MARQSRSKKIYRERSSLALFFKIFGIVIAALIVLFIVIFFWFQRYIVYTGEGLELKIPFLNFLYEGEESNPTPSVSLVIDESETVSDDVQTSPEDIPPENNKLVGIEVESLDGAEIEELLLELDGAEADAVYVNMKSISGELMYLSRSETVVDFDITVGPDISATLAQLKERGVYLVAYISCFADDIFATRCTSASLLDENGEVYTDERNIRWLDPRSEKTMSYFTDICRELSELGFDEVVLTDFSVPTVNSGAEEADILIDFATGLKSVMDETELSVFCTSEVLDVSDEAVITEYTNMFYRIYADSENQDEALSAAESLFGEDFPNKLVIITEGEALEDCGWIISK